MIHIEILSNEEMHILNKMINEKLSEGYSLHGGISVVNTSPNSSLWPRYYQAVIINIDS